MKKILVFRMWALWDVLMTTPFLKELRKKNKDAKIDYLTWKSNKILLENNEFLDEVLIMKDDLYFKYKFIDFFKLILQIRKIKYDEIYVMDKHWIFSLTAFLFWIKKRIGFFRDKLSKIFLTTWVKYWWQVKHEVEYYLSSIWLKNIKNINKKLYFNLQKNDEETIKKFLEKEKIKKFIIVINDWGNNWFEVWWIRMIPDNKFKKLLEIISKDNIVFLLAWANMKSYYAKFILNNKIKNLAWRFKIPESIALMKFADKVYTTDCGPMHMAATVNENIIWFFWPTHPKRKFPFIKNWIYFWWEKDKKKYTFDYEDFGKIPIWESFFEDLNFNFINK